MSASTLRAGGPPAKSGVKPAKRASAFRRDVQGLRAFAVTVVIFNHLVGWPNGGFVGVDIFFVISGYLITGILLREGDATGRISFADFYGRRARRILPAAMLVLGTTVVASCLLLSRTRAVSVIVDGIYGALFTENWRMAAVGTDYFQVGLPPSPLQHYWSLSVEEQFYLIWPVLLLAVLAIAKWRGWGSRGRRLAVVVALGVVVLASLGWALFDSANNPTVAYFSTFSRGWELGIGALTAAGTPVWRRIPDAVRPVIAWVGLAGMVASVILITSTTVFPAPGGIVPVLAAALVLAAGDGNKSVVYDRVLVPVTNRAVTYVGDISYSLYLWHFPIIVLFLAFLPDGSKSYDLACLVAAALLAVITFHFVEEPVRRSGWLRRRKPSGEPAQRPPRKNASRTIRIVCISAAFVFVVAFSGVTLLTPEKATALVSAGGPCFGAAAMANNDTCGGRSKTNQIAPAVDELQQDTDGAYACWRAQGGALKTCHYGSTRADALRVALVGDSHAAMLLPALSAFLQKANWSLDSYIGYGCQWRIDKTSDCVSVMKQVESRLTEPKHPYDLVITTSARWANGSHPASKVPGYVSAWSKVARLGTQIVVVDDVPDGSAAALSCVEQVSFEASTSDCETPRSVALGITDPLPLAARKVPGATSIDLTSLFCTTTECPSVIGNVIVYRDSAGHMTGTYSKTIGPYLMARLQSAVAAAKK